MQSQKWKEKAACRDYDWNLFFDKISQKEWGVWGGVYLEGGKISKEFNRHRDKAKWAETWKYLTMDNK